MQLSETAFDPAPRPAFLTDEPKTILHFACEALEHGIGCALITLVEIRGGAARALGAQMAVRSDGLYCGYVSGGCTEAAVAAEAIAAIRNGVDRYLLLSEGSNFFDIVLPCGGGITLAIHVLRQTGVLRTTLARLKERGRTGARYDPRNQQLSLFPSPGAARWEDGCFIRTYRPRTRIVLCGRSIELEVTSRLAEAVGYEVVALDSARRRLPNSDLFDADTAVAFLHHDLDREMPALQAALRANPFYIGALGSARTHRRRCEMLEAIGFAVDDIGRIKAPIGIFAKARDAQSLALSILADVAATRAASA